MENQSRRIVDFPEQSEVKDGDKLLIDNDESYTHSVPASVFAKAKELSTKQDKLNTAQTNAVNSGITADKVAQIATLSDKIATQIGFLLFDNSYTLKSIYNTIKQNGTIVFSSAGDVTKILTKGNSNTYGVGFLKFEHSFNLCDGVVFCIGSQKAYNIRITDSNVEYSMYSAMDIAQNKTDIAATRTAVSNLGFKKITTKVITCPGNANTWESVKVNFEGNFVTASVVLWGNERADKTASLPALRFINDGVATFGRYNATTSDTFLVTIYTN